MTDSGRGSRSCWPVPSTLVLSRTTYNIHKIQETFLKKGDAGTS